MSKETTCKLIDKEQAAALGLLFEQPVEAACEYCGKTLKRLGAVFNGSLRWITNEACSCDGVIKAEKKRLEEEVQQAKKKQREVLLKCGIKQRYLDAKICNTESNLYLASFEEGKGSGFYIFGRVGRGKTYIASALGIEFIRGGFTTLLISCMTMLESIKATFDSDEATIAVSDRYAKYDILIIDDIGKEIPSAWAVGMLYQVINKRYEDMKPTIFTSQFSIDDLGVQLARRGEREAAEAITSRLHETCQVFHLTGPDLRRSCGN